MNNLVVVVPFASIESPPFATLILEDVATVVPEATVPLPGSTMSMSGWSIVVPFAGPPSVPDTFVVLPLDGWSDSFGAVSADPVVSSVRSYPFHAHFVRGKDSLVIIDNMFVSLFPDSILSSTKLEIKKTILLW